jgi:dihydroneopterin aldolase
MITVQLLSLQFYAYHGVFEEEKKIGADYEVSVSVSHQEKKIPVLHLSETINYVSVYELIKQHMQQPRQLLETVATTFTQDVFARFSEADEVGITIIKKHPPIATFEGSVAVNYTRKRNEE